MTVIEYFKPCWEWLVFVFGLVGCNAVLCMHCWAWPDLKGFGKGFVSYARESKQFLTVFLCVYLTPVMTRKIVLDLSCLQGPDIICLWTLRRYICKLLNRMLTFCSEMKGFHDEMGAYCVSSAHRLLGFYKFIYRFPIFTIVILFIYAQLLQY